MIVISEQYGFKLENRRLLNLKQDCRDKLSEDECYQYKVKRKNDNKLCYEIYFDKDDNDFHFQTSYFIGVDWIMSKDTINAFIKWLSENLHDKKYLIVSWFGGEPLLAFPTIKELTEKIIVLCNKHKCEYFASITTNGYYLTEDIFNSFPKLKIKDVQITFDGDRNIHNKYKFDKNGIGSFDRLVDNVEKYCEMSSNDYPLKIRVNVTDDNFDSIPALLDRFSSNVKESSLIFFRWVFSKRKNKIQ